jgi:hypothetical protein
VTGSGNSFGREYLNIQNNRVGHGAYALQASDRVGNLSTKPLNIYQDFTAPEVTLTVTQTFTTFHVSWSIAEPLLAGGIPGAGLAAYTVKNVFLVQVCPDSPTSCQHEFSLTSARTPQGGSRFLDASSSPCYDLRLWI